MLKTEAGLKFYRETDCKKWLCDKTYYPIESKIHMFEPTIKKRIIDRIHVLDIEGKVFQHNHDRLLKDIEILINNFPQLKSIMKNLKIFMAPRIFAKGYNACANFDYIIISGKPTQIPYTMTDYIISHEIGHFVERNLCYHSNSKFKEYCKLRGIDQVAVDKMIDHRDDELEWDEHPCEIFAEDFRYFFGVEQNKEWMLSINPPQVDIREFMLSL